MGRLVTIVGSWDANRLNVPQDFKVSSALGTGPIARWLTVDYHVTVVGCAYITSQEMQDIIHDAFCGLSPLLPHVTLPLTISNDDSFSMVIDDAH
jgi:hypothetical protein